MSWFDIKMKGRRKKRYSRCFLLMCPDSQDSMTSELFFDRMLRWLLCVPRMLENVGAAYNRGVDGFDSSLYGHSYVICNSVKSSRFPREHWKTKEYISRADACILCLA